MAFNGADPLETQMSNDQMERIKNRRISVEKTYTTTINDLQAQLEQIGEAQVSESRDNAPYNAQMNIYLEELEELIKAKANVESNILWTTREVLEGMKAFRKELGVVLKGREDEVDEMLAVLDGGEGDGEQGKGGGDDGQR